MSKKEDTWITPRQASLILGVRYQTVLNYLGRVLKGDDLREEPHGESVRYKIREAAVRRLQAERGGE